MTKLVNWFQQLAFAFAISFFDHVYVHVPGLGRNSIALRILIDIIPQSHPIVVALALLHPHGGVNDQVLVSVSCDW